MCGFAGFWANNQPRACIAENMIRQIRPRGPDDTGVWVDLHAGLALAHCRLAVVDLTPAGHQPMHAPCGRYTLVYNGEIYNHLDLRELLAREGGHFHWRGHSDTETLLAALCHWGVGGALRRLNGMFAFALWDAAERTLTLARDRMGEKPLYYGHTGEGGSSKAFLFASQLKALTAYPDWRGDIDRNSLALFLRHNHVPAPHSIYQGIFKLPPAHYVVIADGGRVVGEPQCYWRLADVAMAGIAAAAGSHQTSQTLASQTMTDELDALVRDAVGRRMVADVPLGAFLSGGYDSSLVVAQMQAQSHQPVKTFSIGFQDADYNEAPHARAVADHLGTCHTELILTPQQAMAVIPDLPVIYDEPFADASQIPTFLVSRLAREHVTVSLSGDGGDELFGGYNRHVVGPAIWQPLGRLPAPLRAGLSRAVTLAAQLGQVPGLGRVPQLTEKLVKLASALRAEHGLAFYRDLLSHWKQPNAVVRHGREPATLLDCQEDLPTLPGLLEQMMYLDMMTYLPDDILTKVDRASMAVSLEARVPLLDHRLVEFAWQVPSGFKVRDGQGKWLLRQVLQRYVPAQLTDRPKQGFSVPIEHWLRGPLRGWAEALLDEQRLQREGFFDPVPIRRMWDEYVSGRRRHHHALWNVLMFQAWFEATQ
jgi:asparagine synthase (glutamine-hydrolysing)